MAVKCVPKTPQEANALIAQAVRNLRRAQHHYLRAGKTFPASVLDHHTERIANFLRDEL